MFFRHAYKDGFDFNGNIKNSSGAENSDVAEYSVGFGFEPPFGGDFFLGGRGNSYLTELVW